jgi:hypothetical protein
MEYIVTEAQLGKLLKELSPKSSGVNEFIVKVKETEGLLKFLGFKNIKSLRDYIIDGDYDDFEELKKDANSFEQKKKPKK